MKSILFILVVGFVLASCSTNLSTSNKQSLLPPPPAPESVRISTVTISNRPPYIAPQIDRDHLQFIFNATNVGSKSNYIILWSTNNVNDPKFLLSFTNVVGIVHADDTNIYSVPINKSVKQIHYMLDIF